SPRSANARIPVGLVGAWIPPAWRDCRRKRIASPHSVRDAATMAGSITERHMSDPLVVLAEPVLRLRVLVSALGGAGHANWWRTEFLPVAGLRSLGRLYPRTRYSAAIHATAVAARALHDSSIGLGRVYHLFRLPESIEDHLHTLALTGVVTRV